MQIRFEDLQPRNKISYSIHEKIYRFSLQPSVSLTSVKSRDSRDDVRIAKIDFIKDYKRFKTIYNDLKRYITITNNKTITDRNISKIEVELQTKKNKKTHMSTQREFAK